MGNQILDRENALVIDSWEYAPLKRTKPTSQAIGLLRLQRKKVLRAKQEDVCLKQGLEFDICELINQRIPRNCKEKRIKEIVNKIRQLQKERNISEFQRAFLNTLLSTYTNIEERKKQRILKEVLGYAHKHEGVISKKYLEKEDRNKGVKEIILREHFLTTTFYSFL